MFKTLGNRADAVLRVRGSRFFAAAFAADSEEEARRRIAAAEEEHPDASHHCHAYRIGAANSVVGRFSDAGEPAGSAGPPILSAIKGKGLMNVVVVVSRYFGGTKLGIGGLARAYRAAARAALEAGVVRERDVRRRLGLTLPLPLVGETRALLKRMGGDILSESYGPSAELELAIGENLLGEFRDRIDDLTRGAARWSS